MSRSDQRKTTRLFLNEAPQKHFLILQLGILLATLVFLLSIIMTSVTEIMEPSYSVMESGEKINALFDQMVAALFLKVSILFAVVFVLNALLGLFFLQRLTGPLVRIQKILEEIASGRIPDTEIQVREGDYPRDLAQALSGAIAYLRRQKKGF